MGIEIIQNLSQVSPPEWDALAGDDAPFVEHAFLRALESSQSVGKKTGWEPRYVLYREGGVLLGAALLYRKTNSYGEYIFDWGWADAARRAQIRYYPKLCAAVPFTPATGRRFLVRPSADQGVVLRQLVSGAREVAEKEEASSIHILFLTEDEQARLTREHG